MARLRHALIAGFLVSLTASASRAEHCHVETEKHSRPSHVAARYEVANFSQTQYQGNYEGVLLSASTRVERAEFGALLPGYRLTRNGLTYEGLGDAQLRGSYLFDAGGFDGASLSLVASLPSGEASHGLGMGHVMLMPSLAFVREYGKWTVGASLGAGFALGMGSGNHSHAGGHSPTVNPMNASELSASARLHYALTDELRLDTRLFSAFPLVDDGTTRVISASGVRFQRGGLETGLEGAFGLAGDPFGAKLATTLAWLF